MADIIKDRFLCRKENWGVILQDTIQDRAWGVTQEIFDNIQDSNLNYDKYKNIILDEYPYSRKENFILGEYEKISEISAPIGISWEITNRCNSKCLFCCNSSKPDNESKELNLKSIEKLTDILLQWNCLRIVIGGGEPLVRKDIKDILDIFKQKNIKPAIATNAILLNKELIQKIDNNCMTLQISLDSLNKDKYSFLRGIDGLSSVKRNLELAKDGNVNIRVATVINKYNYEELEYIADYLETLHIKQWFLLKLLPAGRGKNVYEQLAEQNDFKIKTKLKEISIKHKNLSVWYWGTNKEDGVSTYIMPDGNFSIVDYMNNITNIITTDTLNLETLKDKWQKIDNYSKIATLKNFTRKNGIY